MSIRQVRRDAVLQLGFDRPERRNAITVQMYAALTEGLAHAASSADIRVVLLHGSPQVFTAGNDLNEFLQSPPQTEASPVLAFLAAIASFEKPLIAAVEGPAVGVGTTVLLHCDLVYAGEGAQLSLPFASLGLCPEAGSSVLLPALAGYARAAEKLLFGEVFSAGEARDMGLVNQVVPSGQALDYALERGNGWRDSRCPPLLHTKRLMRAPLASRVAAAMADESATFRQLLAGPAAREAMAAFLQKRPPDFSKADAQAGEARQ